MIGADEAAARLGVRLPTLYSYASRGMIHVELAPGDARARLYSLDDIERLVWRKTKARKPSGAAASALSWGLPVLETRLSSIEDGRLAYRGRDIAALAETATLEDVAMLLWRAPAGKGGFDPASAPGWREVAAQLAEGPGVDRALVLMALLRSHPGEAGPEGFWRLVTALAYAFAGVSVGAGPLHEALAQAWGRPGSADLIRRILVCCADHELNSSTFSVRVAASTGVDAATCLVAGLAAITGMEHVGLIARTRAMLDEALAAPDVERALRRWAPPGSPLPGFYHRLYPEGDPRAKAVLAALTLPAPLEALIRQVRAGSGLRPNIEFALIAAERVAGLPEGAAEALFVTGRAVGWLAHADEQRASGVWIRPRAQPGPVG